MFRGTPLSKFGLSELKFFMFNVVKFNFLFFFVFIPIVSKILSKSFDTIPSKVNLSKSEKFSLIKSKPFGISSFIIL